MKRKAEERFTTMTISIEYEAGKKAGPALGDVLETFMVLAAMDYEECL